MPIYLKDRKKKNKLFPTLLKVDDTDYSMVIDNHGQLLVAITVWGRSKLHTLGLTYIKDFIEVRNVVILPPVFVGMLDSLASNTTKSLGSLADEVFNKAVTNMEAHEAYSKIFGDSPKRIELTSVKELLKANYTIVYTNLKSIRKYCALAKFNSNRDLIIYEVRWSENKKELIVTSINSYVIPKDLIIKFVNKEEK